VGIVVLAIGAAFTLSLPYAGAPSAAPSLIGYAAAAAVFLLARVWRRAFALVSGNLRGAAMALLYFSTAAVLFGDRHALSASSFAGQAALILAVALNLALALRWRSPWLAGLALATALSRPSPSAQRIRACRRDDPGGRHRDRRARYGWPGFTLLESR